MSQGKQQFNVYLPPELVRSVKHQAIDDQLSLSDWVEKVLRERMNQQEDAMETSQLGTHAKTTVGGDETPATPSAASEPKLSMAPLIHVKDMSKAIAFYEKLGGKLIVGSRDGDWAQVQIGGCEIGLLAHPPSDEDERIELTFNSAVPLTELEAELRAAGVKIARGAADEGFGAQMKVADGDGYTIKINQLEPELYS